MAPGASSSISPDTQTIPVPSDLSPSLSAALPHATQRALLLHLQSDPSTIPTLATTLTTSLASTGWPDRVRALALELLRSGTCTTFPELQAEVLRRAKIPPPPEPPNGTATAEPARKQSTGTSTTNGTQKKGLSNGVSATTTHGSTASAPTVQGQGLGGLPDVRIPLKAVEEGVEFLKARVRDVVEVVEPETLEQGGSGSSDED